MPVDVKWISRTQKNPPKRVVPEYPPVWSLLYLYCSSVWIFPIGLLRVCDLFGNLAAAQHPCVTSEKCSDAKWIAVSTPGKDYFD